jgi:uncharacterized membrane protein YqjE
MGTTDHAGGLFGSLRQLLGTVLEIGHVRLALLGNDLERQKLRIFDGLLLAALGLMLVTVGIVLLCGLIVLLFSEGYRLAALGVLAAAFLGAGALLLRSGGRRLQTPQGVFDATLAELARDRAALAPRE